MEFEVSSDPQASNGSRFMNDQDKTLLMIRALHQAKSFVTELAAPSPVIYAPMVRIETLNADQELPRADIIIFTSSNAVRLYAHKTHDRTSRVVCVGSITARVATERGFNVSHIFETAKQVVAYLQKNISSETPILYPRAETVSLDIADALSDARYAVHNAILYRQTFQPLSVEGIAVIESFPTIVPILSLEVAKRFKDALVSIRPMDLTVVCISVPVAAVFNDLSGFRVEIAQKPDRADLIKQVKASLSA